MSVVQRLQVEVAKLPEAVAVEVLDFLEVVKNRRQVPPSRSASVRGSMRGKLSSSADFARRKQAEI